MINQWLDAYAEMAFGSATAPSSLSLLRPDPAIARFQVTDRM